MSTNYDFVFWQNSFSIHHSSLLRNLAKREDTSVHLVIWDELPEDRIKLGWYKPDYGETKIVLRPSASQRRDIFVRNDSKRIHIFSGTRGFQPTWQALNESLAFRDSIARGVYAEGQNHSGIKGLLKLLIGRYDAINLNDSIDFILAIGEQGVDWFTRCGYSPENIFQYGYFVETPDIKGLHQKNQLSPNAVDIIYVGQFIPRKGIDILLRALSELVSLNWRLHIVGDGIERDKYIDDARKFRISDRIHFLGVRKNTEVIKLIARSDLLVLPSRWDGWGAVINESFLCGVPVVCSDQCGASILVDGYERGEVFPAGDVSKLARLLKKRIESGPQKGVDSRKILDWASCITGETAATYLTDIITSSQGNQMKPAVPWC